MDRIIQKTASTVRLTIRDKDGNAVDATGNVAFVVKDSAGATITSGSAATKPPSTTGIYEITVTPTDATAKLDTYTVEWTAVISGVSNVFVTDFEVISRFFFGIQEFRDEFKPEFDNITTYPATKIVDKREVVEEGLETRCEVAFRPSGRRVTLDGTGTEDILVPDVELRKVVSASIDGVALTSSELADLKVYAHGLIRRGTGAWTCGDLNVVIHYEHGMSSVPARVNRAAMVWAKVLLKPRNVPENATSYTTEEGTFDLGRPGDRAGAFTGIPEVDSVIAEFPGRPQAG